MRKKCKSLFRITKCLILFGLVLQSCETESVFEEIDSLEDLNSSVSRKKKFEDLEENSIEVIKLKNRLEKTHSQIENSNISWDLTYKVRQGSKIGVFVPLKDSTEDNFKLLASLSVHGKKVEYIIERNSEGDDDLFTGEMNFYSAASGTRFKRHKYQKGINMSDLSLKTTTLKSSSTEGDDCIDLCFDDYDDWFDQDALEERFANNYGESIWAKPEHGDEPFEIKPGEYTTRPIDGYKIHDQVHKVTGGYNTGGVNSNGRLRSDYNPATYGYYLYAGGDVGELWLEEGQDVGDHGWDKIFALDLPPKR